MELPKGAKAARDTGAVEGHRNHREPAGERRSQRDPIRGRRRRWTPLEVPKSSGPHRRTTPEGVEAGRPHQWVPKPSRPRRRVPKPADYARERRSQQTLSEGSGASRPCQKVRSRRTQPRQRAPKPTGDRWRTPRPTGTVYARTAYFPQENSKVTKDPHGPVHTRSFDHVTSQQDTEGSSSKPERLHLQALNSAFMESSHNARRAQLKGHRDTYKWDLPQTAKRDEHTSKNSSLIILSVPFLLVISSSTESAHGTTNIPSKDTRSRAPRK